MQLESFRVFRDLVESQSFSKAAQLNNITQSAVSQQIRTIEERYNTPLVERTSKSFSLTREGAIMYHVSREIIIQFDSLQHQLNEIQNNISGSLRIATICSIGLHELPPYIKKFLKEYPNVNIHIEYRRANQVYEDLQTGIADLGLVAYPTTKKNLKIETFKQDRLVVTTAPGHPLANKTEIDLTELAPHKLITFEPDIPTRRALDKMFHEAGGKLTPVKEFDNIETLKRAVEIDTGIAIVPRSAVEQEAAAKNLTIIEFKNQPYHRPLAILYKQDRVWSPAMKRFFKTLRDPLG